MHCYEIICHHQLNWLSSCRATSRSQTNTSRFSSLCSFHIFLLAYIFFHLFLGLIWVGFVWPNSWAPNVRESIATLDNWHELWGMSYARNELCRLYVWFAYPKNKISLKASICRHHEEAQLRAHWIPLNHHSTVALEVLYRIVVTRLFSAKLIHARIREHFS